MTATDQTANNVWDWCSRAYLRQGRKLRLPQGTDRHKTYQWRYVHKIAERLVQWGFDDAVSQRFIDTAIDYAKEKGLLNKGLSILCQNNIMELCHDRLQTEIDQNDDKVTALQRQHNWLSAKVGTRPIVPTLLARPRPDAYCNLSRWYNERSLSELYLSLSASCTTALNRLSVSHPSEREELPGRNRLYLARVCFCQDIQLLRAAKQILRGDWRQ